MRYVQGWATLRSVSSISERHPMSGTRHDWTTFREGNGFSGSWFTRNAIRDVRSSWRMGFCVVGTRKSDTPVFSVKLLRDAGIQIARAAKQKGTFWAILTNLRLRPCLTFDKFRATWGNFWISFYHFLSFLHTFRSLSTPFLSQTSYT